jgi:biopolymer transport protein ExbD
VSRKKKKIGQEISSGSAELNVMPFIDIFSLLCTFLLFSAVFISIGIHTVALPFLSNAASSKSKDDKPKRVLSLNISLEKNRIELRKSWSLPPINKSSESFANSREGLEDFHKNLLQVKSENPSLSQATVFIDDDVTYENISKLLDNLTLKFSSDKITAGSSGVIQQLFPKVIFGSVIL